MIRGDVVAPGRAARLGRSPDRRPAPRRAAAAAGPALRLDRAVLRQPADGADRASSPAARSPSTRTRCTRCCARSRHRASSPASGSTLSAARKRYYRITDAGRAERARLAAELGPRLDRIARSIDAIRDEVARLMGRATASIAGARASPPRPRRSGTTRSAGPPGSTASATSSSCPTAGRRRAGSLWNSTPGGRGRVLETRDRVRAARRPDARGRGQPPARHAAGRVHARRRQREGHARARLRAQGARPADLARWTRCSCAARSPPRCAGRSPASPASGAGIWSWRP